MFKSKIGRKIIVLANKIAPVSVAKARYKQTFGKKLNLNNPQNINEKILWLSLYSDITEWSRLADKYCVREYVKEKGLENTLVKLYGVWESAKDINWDSLPDSFVLKTTNGSGTNLIVPQKNDIDQQEARLIIDSWLNKQIALTTTEFHYRDIKPRVIAEEFLHNPENISEISSTLIDYKIWCFNGKAYYIWACSNRVGNSTEVALFDKDWNYHPEMSVFTEHYKEQKNLVPRPDNLDKMIEISETLSEGFPVVRVDLYNLDGRVYFGEMTFTSLGGQMDFYTDETLLKMGQLIDISKVDKVRNTGWHF